MIKRVGEDNFFNSEMRNLKKICPGAEETM